MKNKFIAICILSFVIFLTACGGGDTKTSSSNNNSDEETTSSSSSNNNSKEETKSSSSNNNKEETKSPSSNNNNKEETKSFVIEESGSLIEIDYTFKGDKVSFQKTHNELDYGVLGFSDKNKAKESLESVVEQYKDLEGITHKIIYEEDKVIEDLKVDYNKVDFDKAKVIPGFEFSGDPSNGVSMKETEKMLKDMGFEEK